MKIQKSYTQGFTLIELLVVIFIIAILTGLAMTNFLGARERARDSKKKAELNIALYHDKALRLYYNDYGKYPTGSPPMNNKINGCGVDGLQACPWNSCKAEFSAGGDGCSTATVYMKSLPKTSTTLFYFQINGGEDYRLYTDLENAADSDLATSQQRCPSSGGASCTNKAYCVCAD